MDTTLIVSDGAFPQTVRTHPLPDGTDRVFKPDGETAVEITSSSAVSVHASHFMVIPILELGDVRHASYYQSTKVPAIVEDARFLGACELFKYGDQSELVFRAISKEFVGLVSKKSKAERCDIAHCWSVNAATLAKICENYTAEKYTGVDLSSADKAAFDAFFAVAKGKGRNSHIHLELESEKGKKEAETAGFEVTSAYATIDKSINSLSKRKSEAAKCVLKNEELLAENEFLRKKARLIDGEPTINASGEVSVWLKIKKDDEDGQVLVKGRLLDCE